MQNVGTKWVSSLQDGDVTLTKHHAILKQLNKNSWQILDNVGPMVTNGLSADLPRVSVCSGDSGGPLTVNENGVHVVVGVVSANWDCSGNNPALFSRVTTFLPWIRENIKDGDWGGN